MTTSTNFTQNVIGRATIIDFTSSWYTLRTQEGENLQARLRGRFKQNKIFTNPLCTGDEVCFIRDAHDDKQAIITDLCERKNTFSRVSPKHSHLRHVLASNIDRVLILCSLARPHTPTHFIDRCLVQCAMENLPAEIVFNKIESYSQKEQIRLHELQKIYQKIGYTVHSISLFEDAQASEKLLADDHTRTLLVGYSGVGKSTLVAQRCPQERIKTRAVNPRHGQGRHTTTHTRMYFFSNTSTLVDTPGIKEIPLAFHKPIEIALYFPEFLPFMEHCNFRNCLHLSSDHCAVTKAVANGEIARSRYESYVQIVRTTTSTYT